MEVHKVHCHRHRLSRSYIPRCTLLKAVRTDDNSEGHLKWALRPRSPFRGRTCSFRDNTRKICHYIFRDTSCHRHHCQITCSSNKDMTRHRTSTVNLRVRLEEDQKSPQRLAFQHQSSLHIPWDC